MGQEALQGEDIYNFADQSLEIIIRFDDQGKVLYGNALAKEELGYGEKLTDISLNVLFPAELSSEDDSFPMEIVEKLKGGTMYRKNGLGFQYV